MKKIKWTVVLLGVLIFSTSCHMGHGKRVITVSENDFSLRIEYSGRITFTEDSTAVKTISPNGHLTFDVNGKKLEAKDRGGKIVYRLYDNEETTTLSENDKIFVTDAVHEMIKRGHYRN